MFGNESEKPYHVDKIYWDQLHGMLVQALSEKGTNAHEIALAMAEDLRGEPCSTIRDLERNLKTFLLAVRYAARGQQPDPDMHMLGEFREVDKYPTPPAAFQFLLATMLGFTRNENTIAHALLRIGMTKRHIHAFFRQDLGQIIDDALDSGQARIANVLSHLDDEKRRSDRLAEQHLIEITPISIIEHATQKGNSLDSLRPEQLQALINAIKAEL